jgi:hypothetical protein
MQTFTSQYYLLGTIKYKFEVVNLEKNLFFCQKYLLTIKLKIYEIVLKIAQHMYFNGRNVSLVLSISYEL